jgi:hypothetical protein
MLKKAKEAAARETIDEAIYTKDWISTTSHDFDHSDLYPEICDLGIKQPLVNLNKGTIVLTQEEKDKYETPITYFTEDFKNGNVISSLSSTIHANQDSQQTVGQDGKPLKLVFGKNVNFSTPINQSMNPNPPN